MPFSEGGETEKMSNESEPSQQRREKPVVKKGSLVASWAEKLRADGMPEQLIDYVKKAEFEAWVQQQDHKIGNGLYYSEDFRDLPPRFQKKIIEIAYQLSEQMCTKEEFISQITNQQAGLPQTSKGSDLSSHKVSQTSPDQNSQIKHIHAPHCVSKNEKTHTSCEQPDKICLEEERESANVPKQLNAISNAVIPHSLSDNRKGSRTVTGSEKRPNKGRQSQSNQPLFSDKDARNEKNCDRPNKERQSQLSQSSSSDKDVRTMKNFERRQEGKKPAQISESSLSDKDARNEKSYDRRPNKGRQSQFGQSSFSDNDARTKERLKSSSGKGKPNLSQFSGSNKDSRIAQNFETRPNKERQPQFSQSSCLDNDFRTVDNFERRPNKERQSKSSQSSCLDTDSRTGERQSSYSDREYVETSKRRPNKEKQQKFDQSSSSDKSHRTEESSKRRPNKENRNLNQPSCFDKDSITEKKIENRQDGERHSQINKSLCSDTDFKADESFEKVPGSGKYQHFSQSLVSHRGSRTGRKFGGSNRRKPNTGSFSSDRSSSDCHSNFNRSNEGELRETFDTSSGHSSLRSSKGSPKHKKGIEENLGSESKSFLSSHVDNDNISNTNNHVSSHSPNSFKGFPEHYKGRKQQDSKSRSFSESETSSFLSQGLENPHNDEEDEHLNGRKIENCSIVEITVSDFVEDVAHWKNYITYVIGSKYFHIFSFCTATKVIRLAFSSPNMARKASVLMKKEKCTKNSGSACIKKVSGVKFANSSKLNKYQVTPRDKISCKNMEFVKMLFMKKMKDHSQKIEVVEQEFSRLQRGGSKNKLSLEAVKGKLGSLKEMCQVFISYYKKIEEEMKMISLDANLLDRINELKSSFTHECNSLDSCLPIYTKKNEILKKVEDNQVTIIVADTGSGKSTQLVQYLWRNGYSKKGTIICAQPRKIAAVSLCKYVSGQVGSVPGQVVGYETGTIKKISKFTQIFFMTDYTLLRKCSMDSEMSKISCIIVDEAHERSLYTDLLLGMLKQILSIRPDLKLIITSATIDPDIFLNFFDCPSDVVVDVPGRMYPVEVLYQNDDAHIGWNYLKASVDCAYDIHTNHESGSILVFLTSPDETEEAKNMLEWRLCHRKGNIEILALHGKQEIEDQLTVFKKENNSRKIIFATNSAETSLTIPDIKFIVDSGMSKQLRYDRDKRRSMLIVDFISRSSANQRKGRAGRTQPGYCYRMYSEQNYQEMLEDTEPEILCSPLQEALVKILELNIQPEEFDFITAPPKSSIRDSMQSLQHLGVVHGQYLTALGKKIAKLPLRPQLGKLIIESRSVGLTYEAIVIVALMSISGRAFIRTEDNKKEADKEKVKFCHPKGDLFTLLTVFYEWSLCADHRKQSWCEKNFIHHKAMKTALSLINEFTRTLNSEIIFETSFKRYLRPPEEFLSLYEQFECILFSCFSENLFIFSGHAKAGYLSIFYDGSYFIHPSSAISYLQEKPPAFIICGNVLKTSRNFLVDVTPISEKTIMAAYEANTFDYPVSLLKGVKVVPKLFRPFGEVVLVKHVLGKDGVNIKDIERRVNFLTKTQTFYLDVSVQKGEIILYVEERHLKTVSDIIQKAINAGRQILAREESIQPSNTKDYYFAFGSGGLVHDLILPGETREVIINQVNRNFNVDEVLNELRTYGPIVSHSFHETGSSMSSIVFKNVASAQKALKYMSKHYFIVQGKVNIPAKIKNNPSLFQIEVRWRRLNCTGSGYIVFPDKQSCIEACYKLTTLSFHVGNNYIVVEASPRKPVELSIRNLPQNAEECDVKVALVNHLPSHLHECDIHLNRKIAHEASNSDISSQNKHLLNIFAPFASAAKDIFIDLKRPSRIDSMWEAVVSYTNFEDGEKAISKLKKGVIINRQKAQLNLILNFAINCRRKVFSVLRHRIDECRRKFHKLNSSTKISNSSLDYPVIKIDVSCDDVRHLAELRKELTSLIQGKHINCQGNPKLLKLFSRNSSSNFEEIEHTTHTVIYSDSFRKVITIFGPKRNIDEAEQLINDSANARSTVKKTMVFNLLGSGMPFGFTKMLYIKYGFGLEGLMKSFKLNNAYLDFARHRLILEGSLEKINQAEEYLERLCGELQKSNEEGKTVEEESEVCPVCLDKITWSESIRLENCGHAVCKICLHLQIKSEVFPVACIKEGCDSQFFVEDFRKIFISQPGLSNPFKDAALKFFMTQNGNLARYCPTPNCFMVYRPSGGKIVCLDCENTICTQCHCLYHHGMSCDMYMQTRIDEDYPLKVWQQQDSANRKSCPSCKTAIEKDGGCNHMTCSHCKQHICWNCLKVFQEPEQVYDHMPTCLAST